MDLKTLRQVICEHYCIDEISYIVKLHSALGRDEAALQLIERLATRVCESVLANQNANNNLQALLHEYQLSTNEGIALMALTESLLRIPDQRVATQLIADRIDAQDWEHHLREGSPALVNASTMLLMLTGKLLSPTDPLVQEGGLHKFIRRLSQPMIHKAVKHVIKTMASQFVFAEDIHLAQTAIEANENQRDLYSLDMLGEAAVCHADAERFQLAYMQALEVIGEWGLQQRAGISIKLSALDPRYEIRHGEACQKRLNERLKPLMAKANQYGIDITLDAEEAERLELSLNCFTALFTHAEGRQVGGLGLAVQAYGLRALSVLKYLKHLAELTGRTIPVRLVKGAYWDSEIKQAQLAGLEGYPVFTHKHHTDLSYLVCAEYLLNNRDCFYPQFATHNAVTISDILHLAEPGDSYEFQRLHGMGEAIYAGFRQHYPGLPVRIYGPVGEHQTLLPYLVRRILENGANSAFLKQLFDHNELADLCRHPCQIPLATDGAIPLPDKIYEPVRKNSEGLNLANSSEREALMDTLNSLKTQTWDGDEIVSESHQHLALQDVLSPYDGHHVGTCGTVDEASALAALYDAYESVDAWRSRPAIERVVILRKFGEALSANRLQFVSLLIREAGKTIPDAINEVREAEDFIFYYARLAEEVCASPIELPAVAGEQNQLFWRGRGVFLCISPWNFPLAIFVGQVCAALAAGNTVLAKPAESTPLIARLAVGLLHQSGVPRSVLHFLPGAGSKIGPVLCKDERLAGVAFTGSTSTARQIAAILGQRDAAIIPLIAETGGQNVMLVDSSALPEQVVKDVIQSAFYSAGQRCSALRVLYLQADIADKVIDLLKGAMDTLTLGDPGELGSDIGPVISRDAWNSLQTHCQCLAANDQLVYRYPIADDTDQRLFPPHVFEINSINDLKDEHFGPILHIVRFEYEAVDAVVDEINAYGFGLTCGIHSRNERWAKSVANRLNIGNIYINRDMVGAVVGTQPFGGQGLSGTGFKAGGPHYLYRFMTEVTLTNNLSAIGGDVNLVAPNKKA